MGETRGNIPKPVVTPVFMGEQIVGNVQFSTDDDVLIVRLNKRSTLIKELMKEELASFDIHMIPARQGN